MFYKILTQPIPATGRALTNGEIKKLRKHIKPVCAKSWVMRIACNDQGIVFECRCGQLHKTTMKVSQ